MKDLKEVIKDFVKRPNKEMALMIDGEWGVGKTYFLKNLQPKEFGKEKVIFVSLKGVKNTEDINRKVLAAVWKIGKKFNLFSEITKNAIQAGTGGLVSVSLTDLASIGFDWKKLSNLIIIFDDLERISSENISYHEVLFEIHSTYIEDKNASVIVISNEKEILNTIRATDISIDKKQTNLNSNEKNYQHAKEKTIERTVKFSRNLKDFFQEYIKTRYSEYSSEIQEFLLKNDVITKILQREGRNNLRDYNRFFDLFIQIYETVNTYPLNCSYKTRFLNEVLICLRDTILYSLVNSDEVPALETIDLPDGYVRIEMFPSIKQFIDKGFLQVYELKQDIDRRVKVYKLNNSISKDFNTIRRWFMLPRRKSLKSFERIAKKSNQFTTYDLFLETMRYLSWFFNSGMIEKDLFEQHKNILLENFRNYLLQLDDINLTISGMATEREFIDTLNKCKEIQTQKKLKRYEKLLFTKNKLIDDSVFVEFVRKNPAIVLEMYTKNAAKIAKVQKLYIHTKFLVGCLKHSTALALIKPSPWIDLSSKIIEYLDDPAAAAVTQMILDEVITVKSPSYNELNDKLKKRKIFLLKQDGTK